MTTATRFLFISSPQKKTLRNKWKHAIRREEGPHFKITESTKVCSRHFRDSDIKKTLAGKHLLKPDAVPSLFPWTRTSPRKRKSPKERIVSPSSTVDIGSLNEVEDVEEGVLEQIEEFEVNEVRQVVYVEIATQTDCHADEFEAIVTEVTTKGETIQILQQEINELQSQIKNLQEHIEKLQQRVFSLNRFMSNDKAAHFYTGFDNWDAFMIIYKYLNAGQKGENIRYWNSSNTNVSPGELNPDRGGRPRTLSPLN